IALVTRPHGGAGSTLIRFQSRSGSGSTRGRMANLRQRELIARSAPLRSSPAPLARRYAARWSGIVRCAGFSSLQLQHDCAFRDSWSGHTSFASILGDPLPCCPTALVGTSLVLVDRDREPSASGAHEGIAHETLYPLDETFHFSFVLLQEVEKRLCPFARIVSHYSMHDTPPIQPMFFR